MPAFLALCFRMRRLATIFIAGIVFVAGSCASQSGNVGAKEVAARLQVPESKIMSLARMAAESRRMVITRIASQNEATFQVWLADVPGRPHGIVVVFRRENGQWTEDLKSQGEWII
jgi:hypothetical protein